MNTADPMKQIEPDRWARLRERFRNAAQIPLLALAVVISLMASWVGIWLCFRAFEWTYENLLKRSWVE